MLRHGQVGKRAGGSGTRNAVWCGDNFQEMGTGRDSGTPKFRLPHPPLPAFSKPPGTAARLSLLTRPKPRGTPTVDSALTVHRLHFAFTITFHYLFPQLT